MASIQATGSLLQYSLMAGHIDGWVHLGILLFVCQENEVK